MAPIRSYSNWNSRPSDHQEKVEPYRKYYIIAEGKNTERWYFEKLIDLRKELGIHPMIDIIFCEREGEDESKSNPTQLLQLADQQRRTDLFDKRHDKMIVVFDTDIYEREGAKAKGLNEIIRDGSKNNILGITNPSFELFLLLHYENAYAEDIRGHEEEILADRKIQSQRFIATLLLKHTGMNAKKNEQIGNLAKNVAIAIEQEKNVNQDITQTHGNVTSNIGTIIRMIIDDNPKP